MKQSGRFTLPLAVHSLAAKAAQQPQEARGGKQRVIVYLPPPPGNDAVQKAGQNQIGARDRVQSGPSTSKEASVAPTRGVAETKPPSAWSVKRVRNDERIKTELEEDRMLLNGLPSRNRTPQLQQAPKVEEDNHDRLHQSPSHPFVDNEREVYDEDSMRIRFSASDVTNFYPKARSSMLQVRYNILSNASPQLICTSSKKPLICDC